MARHNAAVSKSHSVLVIFTPSAQYLFSLRHQFLFGNYHLTSIRVTMTLHIGAALRAGGALKSNNKRIDIIHRVDIIP